MKAYVFMNEQIRKTKPTRPVFRVQFDDGSFGDTNGPLDLPLGARLVYDPKGCKAITTHKVKAWIEFPASSLRYVLDPGGCKAAGHQWTGGFCAYCDAVKR